MSERLSYPETSFPGGSASSSLTPPVPAAQPQAALPSNPATTPTSEVELPGEMTLPQILEGTGGTGSAPSPQTLQPQVNSSQAPAKRAAYQARPRRVIEKTVTTQGKSHKLRISNLRNRMLIHTVLISALSLTIVGFILLISGMFQISYAERTQTEAITADVRNFTAVENAKSTGGLASAKDAVTKFINAADAPYNGSLLGFSEGKLTAHKCARDSAAHQDKQLLKQLASYADMGSAKMFMLRTDQATYAVGIVPISAAGTDDALLAVVSNYSADIAPTQTQLLLFSGISFLVLALVGLVNVRASQSLLAPIARLREMMASISSEQDLTKRLPVEGNDDLADVTRQMNSMISRLQSTFDEQRNLLNDVGHELRTPITVVRGHLELLDPNDPQDTSRTRELALEELSRMHRLTEDLITVAKSDRPDFIRPERVDIGDLLMDTFENATQLGDFNWRIDNVTIVKTTADHQRLQQALLALAQNASKFATPGTVIALGAGIDYQQPLLDKQGNMLKAATITAPSLQMQPQVPSVVGTHRLNLWVRDQGIGIDPKDQEQVFGRFMRVNHSYAGSGLGLSIVNAIAQAHGGILQVRSVLSVGSVFNISLPISDDDCKDEIQGE
ncbi:sensor histidine kinase [Varibaculum vaginae]|uniref:sensor histidine kinase n=1 Tax=Varibaculum vaginae TaxID=2364797 RepID=UPI000F081EAC|nr:HAMP domain-containing sensor histidine kinase [Varibaculum vaginae]